MDADFDALDAILAAIGPVRRQLDDVRTLVRNLIATSLETDPSVQAAVAKVKRAINARAHQGRIIIRPSVWRR